MNIADLRQKAADYNPRRISSAKLSGLKKALAEFGNLSDIVFNRRTGNLVTFHQRVKCAPKDAEIIIEMTYDPPTEIGTIAEGYMRIRGERFGYREVDWDLHKEKKANIAANNAGGEFDSDLLPNILRDIMEQEPNLEPEMFGFTQTDLDNLIMTDGQESINIAKDLEKTHEVVIECASEIEQEQLYKRFKQEGLKCRVLTL